MKIFAIMALTLATAVACAHQPSDSNAATTVIEPRSGSSVAGTVRFVPVAGGPMRVEIQLSGLTPGAHGFHIHEKGDCSAPDASSAGGHFNPTSAPHAAPGAAAHHAGDFGNITADASGIVRTTVNAPWLSMEGPSSIVGKSVVVHADPDDLTSQPAGNSGKRVGCGVIPPPAPSM